MDPAAITRRLQDILGRGRQPTGPSGHDELEGAFPEDLERTLPALGEAAQRFTRSLVAALADQTGHPTETYIAGAAAVAGRLACGLGTGAEQDQILRFMKSAGSGVKLSSGGWSSTIPKHHRPTIGDGELLARLMPAFDEAVAEVGLEPRFHPFAAAFAALMLVAAGRD